MKKGQKHTEKSKIRISKTNKRKKITPPKKYWFKKGEHTSLNTEFKKGHTSNRGLKRSKETIQKLIEIRKHSIFPKKDSSIEIKIQNFLKKLGISFFTHQYINIEHGYQYDILIPSLNLVVEVDGDYWHKYPIGRDIDHIRTSELIEKGFKVLRLWEHEIRKMSITNFKEKLNGEGI